MKLTKKQLKKETQEILALLHSDKKLTGEEIDKIYEDLNPGGFGDVSANAAFFTPYYLAQDVAVMCQARGHVLDLCAGIGMLSYRTHQMDSYEHRIKSIACIELNPMPVEIGKKLLPQANWICGSVFDKTLIENVLKEKGIDRFDSIESNPPFGKVLAKEKVDWLNYNNNRDLMVLEVVLRYGEDAYFILPSGSVPFRYSGERYRQHTEPRDLKSFVKLNKEFQFDMVCDGIDCAIFKDEWKNLNGISVEAVNIQIHPYYLCDANNSLYNRWYKEG